MKWKWNENKQLHSNASHKPEVESSNSITIGAKLTTMTTMKKASNAVEWTNRWRRSLGGAIFHGTMASCEAPAEMVALSWDFGSRSWANAVVDATAEIERVGPKWFLSVTCKERKSSLKACFEGGAEMQRVEWLHEWINEWIKEWMNMNGLISGVLLNETRKERTNKMNKWMNEWMNEWMNK